MLLNLIIYILAFCGIWIGSGLAISSVERVSKILRISSFAISFLVLGFFTSVSELSVGINAVLQNDPEIYVGNLIGASIVIFMLIIPLLAIVCNGIKINTEFRGVNLFGSILVVGLPVFMVIDGKMGRLDSLAAIITFGILVLGIQARRGLLEHVKSIGNKSKTKLGRELLKIVLGLAIIFIASKFVVEQTMYFSNLIHLSPFVISLLLIGIGTNIPELSIVVRSAFMKNNQVAFGDYVGSAAFNTFLMGVLTIVYGRGVMLTGSYWVSFVFLIIGLAAFYYFARTKNAISRIEGLTLLVLYLIFIVVEVVVH